jgi:hypothetical protein
MTRYEAIESKVWRSATGRTVSIYGALPWFSEAQKQAEGWTLVVTGFTVRNLSDGTVGIGRVPWKTLEEAQAWIARVEEEARTNYFDYDKQAWVIGGVYQRCGHPETMRCDCYGRIHAGKRAPWQGEVPA